MRTFRRMVHHSGHSVILSTNDISSPDYIRTSELPSISLCDASVRAVVGPIRWEAPTVEDVSALMPGFEFLGLIGRGGMGAVYKARQIARNRIVAVKMLPPEISEEADYRKRFEREMLAMEYLRHPRIIALFERGVTSEKSMYFVMEYVDGTGLAAAVQAKTLAPAEAVRIMLDVCEGLAYAHERGVVHRDIKPANVLIDKEGRAKIADFGTARLRPPGIEHSTHTTGILFATKDYAAPELLASEPADHRADIYSLGVMLHELLCFDLPRAHDAPPSEVASVDPRVDAIVKTAMQRNPELRYASVAAMRADILQVGLAKAQSSKTKASQPRRQAGRWYLWGLLGTVAIAAVLAMSGRLGIRDASPRALAPSVSLPSLALLPPVEKTHRLAVPVLPVPAVDPWHTWLTDETGAAAGLEKGEFGWSLPSASAASNLNLAVSPVLKDQAIRVTYRAAGSGRPLIRVYVRSSENFEEFFGAFNSTIGWQISRSRPNGRAEAYSKVSREPGFDMSKPETVELQIKGDRLEFRLNGETKFNKRAEGFDEGRAVVYCGRGVILQSIEWRDATQ